MKHRHLLALWRSTVFGREHAGQANVIKPAPGGLQHMNREDILMARTNGLKPRSRNRQKLGRSRLEARTTKGFPVAECSRTRCHCGPSALA